MIAIWISLLCNLGIVGLAVMDISIVLERERGVKETAILFSLSTEYAYHIGLAVVAFALIAVPVLYLWERKDRRR